MKNCPFCKKSIKDGEDFCPHCKHVLIERMDSYYNKPNSTKHKNSISVIHRLKSKFKLLIGSFGWRAFRKYIPLVVLLLLIIFISTQKEDNGRYKKNNKVPVSVIPSNTDYNTDLPSESDDNPITPLKDPKDYVSLSNGTILSKNSYLLNGSGELKIDNGTSLDAIAKLVNISTNKSIITVYIKANSIYTMKDISDDNYKLFFNLGNDWDNEVKAFAINSSYEVFEENFNFTTLEYEDGDYIKTKYKTFEVTLNPVVGGQAETEEINAAEFGNY